MDLSTAPGASNMKHVIQGCVGIRVVLFWFAWFRCNLVLVLVFVNDNQIRAVFWTEHTNTEALCGRLPTHHSQSFFKNS